MRRSDFERLVDQVIEDLPEWVIAKIENLAIVVEDHPPAGQPDLLGLYEGISLAEREEYSGVMPDTIIIFRTPHIATGLTGGELQAEIRKTVLHEIAHHLGIDDTRLAELGWD